MLVHSVFFWLKPELSDAQKIAFRAGLESLRGVKFAETIYIGTPAPVPARPTIDASYSFNLTVIFKDVVSQNAYQIDPIHRSFVENNKAFWTRVQVYDSE